MNHQAKHKKRNSIDSSAIFEDFTPDDGVEFSKWRSSLPVFNNFFVIGPKTFQDSKPSVLFEYPPTNTAKDFAIEQFLFTDGLDFNNVKIANTADVYEQLFSQNKEIEEIVIVKTELGCTKYIYCLRFRANPFNRPSLDDPTLFEDAKYFSSLKLIPSCLFAICFVSSHPFYDFLFSLLHSILDMELQYRSVSINLLSLGPCCSESTPQNLPEWPKYSFVQRTTFLSSLYNFPLPVFNEKIVIVLGNHDQITWKMPPPTEITTYFSMWGYQPLLSWISAADIVRLTSALLTEKPIAVVSNFIQKVVKVTSFLPFIVEPLSWTTPVISILPPSLFDMFDSPIPIIVGVHRSFRKQIPNDFIILDLDRQEMIVPRESDLRITPHSKEFITTITPLLARMKGSQSTESAKKVLREIKNHIWSIFAKPILNSMATMIAENSQMRGTAFIKEMFLERFKKEDMEFIGQFLDTQLFQSFKEQQCLEKTKRNSDGKPKSNEHLTMGELSLQMTGVRVPSVFSMMEEMASGK